MCFLVRTRMQSHFLAPLRTVGVLVFVAAAVTAALFHAGSASASDAPFTERWPDPGYNSGGSRLANSNQLNSPLALVESFDLDLEPLEVVVGADRYFVRGGESVIAFDRATHEEAWRYSADGSAAAVINQIALDREDRVVLLVQKFESVGQISNVIVMLEPDDGNLIKEIALDASVSAAMVVGRGAVYTLSTGITSQGIVSALQAFDTSDGSERWRSPINLELLRSRLVLGDVDRQLYFADGPTLRRFTLTDEGAEEVWTYTDTISNFDDAYDLMYVNGVLIAARGDAILGFDDKGQLIWQKSPRPVGECVLPPKTYLASDGLYLGVMSYCDAQVELRRAQEGTPIIAEYDAGDFAGAGQPVIAADRDTLIVGTLPSPSNPVLRLFDLRTGELLTPLAVDSIPFHMATADGLLYTVGSGGVRIYEQSKADLAVSVQARTNGCGIVTGGTVPYFVEITNNGPGDAETAVLRIRTSPTIAQVDVSQGTCEITSDGSATCDIGAIPVGDTASVVLTMEVTEQAGAAPVFSVMADVSSGQPDTDAGNNSDSVALEPLPAAPGGDLVASFLEVTQAIQNLNNDVPLIADKSTLVRLHVDSGGAEMGGVTAELHGTTEGGTPLPGSPLQAGNRCATIQTNGPDRFNLNQTLNFELPPEWTRAGAKKLRAVVNADNSVPEADAGNNTVQADVRFINQPPICVKTYRVSTLDQNSQEVSLPTLYMRFEDDGIRDQALALLPTSEVRYFPESNILERFLLTEGFVPYIFPDDKSLVLVTLWFHDRLSIDPEECDELNARTLHLGMVHPDTPRDTTGSAATAIDQLWAILIPEDGTKLHDSPLGGRTLAHEIGHNFDRLHPDCGNPARDSLDEDYPYDPCMLDDGPSDSPATHFGIDLSNGIRMTATTMITPTVAISPAVTGDLMSYADSRWASDYTWNAIAKAICTGNDILSCTWPPDAAQAQSSRSSAPLPALAADNDVLLVTGFVDSTDAIELERLLRLPQDQAPADKIAEAAPVTDSPTHAILLLDASDNVLLEQPFEVASVAESDDNFFGLAIPWQAGTAKIVVRNAANTQSAAMLVSPSAPTVKLDSPNGGETISGDSMTVTWTAGDADGDELSFILQYSRDNGQTWQVLSANLGGDSYEFDVSVLGGSQQARLRIIASDGINSASDETDGPFALRDKAPLVEITQPKEGEDLLGGSALILRGNAYDPEDGTLAADALSWTVSGRGAIGNGTTQTLYNLPDGEYTITLQATDSQGQSAERSVTVRIQTPDLQEIPAPDLPTGDVYLPALAR